MEDDTASVLESVLNERRNIPWDNVAGLDEAKKSLMEIVICPLKFPHLFRGLRQPCRNILLYGAPGTGKTYLANALATEAKGSNFFSISAYNLISKYVGTSEKLVKCLFSLARDKKPSIIFIDDVDALCRDSERASTARNEFLVQMYDEGNDGVFVVGATSVPWVLGPATRKCFVKRIHIPLPDMSARVRLFQLRLGTTQHSLTEEDIKELGQKTDGFTGADIHVVVGDGMMQYIRKVQKATHFKKVEGPSKSDPVVMVDDLLTPCSPDDDGAIEMNWTQLDVDKLYEAVVSMADILMSLSSQKPSITNEDLKRLEDFTKDYVQM